MISVICYLVTLCNNILFRVIVIMPLKSRHDNVDDNDDEGEPMNTYVKITFWLLKVILHLF